jgi:hypothetical protein
MAKHDNLFGPKVPPTPQAIKIDTESILVCPAVEPENKSHRQKQNYVGEKIFSVSRPGELNFIGDAKFKGNEGDENHHNYNIP